MGELRFDFLATRRNGDSLMPETKQTLAPQSGCREPARQAERETENRIAVLKMDPCQNICFD
jgi:hypothetical protein